MRLKYVYMWSSIQSIKLLNILNARVPIDLIPYMSDIMPMCCVLTNLQDPVIKEGS